MREVLKLKIQNSSAQASLLMTTRKSIVVQTLKRSRLMSKVRPLERIKSLPMVFKLRNPKYPNQA